MERTCSVDDCAKPVLARNLCRRHYQWAWKNGFAGSIEPPPPRPGQHRLTEIDPEARTATCSICGPTRIRYRAKKASECWTVRRRYAAPRDTEAYRRKKRRSLLRQYDMSVDDYEALFASQGHRCAICRRKQRDDERTFPVDHCHAAGGVRGILCPACNTALGLLRENPKTMLAMAKYAERTRQGTLFWEGPTKPGDEATELSA